MGNAIFGAPYGALFYGAGSRKTGGADKKGPANREAVCYQAFLTMRSVWERREGLSSRVCCGVVTQAVSTQTKVL